MDEYAAAHSTDVPGTGDWHSAPLYSKRLQTEAFPLAETPNIQCFLSRMDRHDKIGMSTS